MKKILIIEDDQIVANVYRNKLLVEGFQVEVANEGQAGLELVSTFQPDLIILDLMLPDLPGVEIMKKLRAQPAFEKLPIIVFSNTYLSNVMKEAWKAGASKCFSKASCTPKQIIEAIHSLVSSATTASATAPAAPPAAAPVAPPPTKLKMADPAVAPAEPVKAKLKMAEPAPAAPPPDLGEDFRKQFPGQLNTLRALHQTLVKTPDAEGRMQSLEAIYANIHTLAGNASVAGTTSLAHMAEALEALVRELQEKPQNLTPSTIRTVASTIDFLEFIFKRGKAADTLKSRPARILVVDDELLSRRGVTHALEKAKLTSQDLDDPIAALQLLADNSYDLVILDADMPGMNGFELCAKLRSIPAHKKTPVVFVTNLTDFEARANSTMAGANDFIAKPFMFIELAVKALVYVLRGRLEGIKPSL
ncbi:MAG: response regulator [Verrucomicrobia bacterium]|nr:response regulator [Verrucomicrobiota bacterium]